MPSKGVNLRQVILLIGLVVLAVMVMDFNNRMAELHRLSDQEELVSAQATSVVRTQVYLETQIAYATSDAAVEEWARVQAHMIQPGDRPVVPLAPTSQVPLATPVPEMVHEPVSNPEVWYALFFEDRP